MNGFSQATSGVKISDAKASIFEELKRMRERQDIQRQEFRNKQLMEHQKLLKETEMNIGKYYEINKEVFGFSENSATDQSQSVSEVSFPDQSSSVNGHMLNCFSDDSFDNTPVGKNKANTEYQAGPFPNGGFSSLSEISSQAPYLQENNKEDVNPAISKQSTSKRPIRPFLKKGAGLERYKPKSKMKKVAPPKPPVEQKTAVPQRKVTLKLKPAIHKADSPPRKSNHVKFSDPIQVINEETIPKQMFDASVDNSDSQISVNDVEENELETEEYNGNNTSSDISLNSETKELAEFEMLEDCAQNSSFNSESSVVQRVLNGQTLKPVQKLPQRSHSDVQSLNYIRSERKPPENPVIFSSLDLDSRKQRLEDFISHFEPKIASPKNEVTASNITEFEGYDSDEKKRCSTPVEDTDPLSDGNSSKNSSLNSVILAPHIVNGNNESNMFIEGDRMTRFGIDSNFEEKNDIGKSDEATNRGQFDKSKLREKMEELEKEIQNYQTERAQLAAISKERDMVLKELKKERDDFQKYKDEEMSKFHSEMESQKQQFKREKETFNRLKKVTKDYRNRKEREDLSTLKQEVESLQKELKKEKIKFNNETRRLKCQLAAAEKDRDNLKLENIHLEDQIADLVSTLKIRIALEGKSEAKVQTKGHSKAGKKTDINVKKTSFDSQENNCSDSSDSSKEVFVNLEPVNTESSATKPKVRFNLSPQQSEKYENSLLTDIGFISANDKQKENSRSRLYDDFVAQTTEDGNNEKPPYEEIQYDDKTERIYNSGEVEIFFPSGTRKRADGTTIKFFYSNGDEKEIFPDKRTVYKFINGDIEQSFPSGLVITELVNGQIQKMNPDGSKEVTFSDGSYHFTYSDGTQEITYVDGTKAYIDLDGTETIKYKNGEREIHKEDYKRKEFLDGSAKTIYKSGRQETRYANGRIKIKDVNGKLVLDTKHLKSFVG